VSGPYTVQPSEVTSGIRRVLERSLLLRLENASALHLELKVDLAGTGAEASATLFPKGEIIMRMLELDLPAPSVTGVTDGHLDPEQVPDSGVVITVPQYTNMEVGQWLSGRWTSAVSANDYTIAPQKIVALGPVVLHVPKEIAIKSKDMAVNFSYSVARTQEAVAETSKSVPFFVGRRQGFTRFYDFEGQDFKYASGKMVGGAMINGQPSANIITGPDYPPFITGKRIGARSTGSNAHLDAVLNDEVMSITMGVYVDKKSPMSFAYLGGLTEQMQIEAGPQRISSNPSLKCTGFRIGQYNSDVLIDNIEFTYR